MQPVALASGLLHQPAMPQRKGIGVHYDGADFFSGLAIHPELAAIAGQAFAAVLHQNGPVARTGDRPETGAGKEGRVIRFSEQKQLAAAQLIRQGHQFSQQLQAKPFSLQRRVDGNALQHASGNRAAANNAPLVLGDNHYFAIRLERELMLMKKEVNGLSPPGIFLYHEAF